MQADRSTTLQLPAFTAANVEAWFVSCEQQFVNYNITADEIQFAHLISALSGDVCQRVMPAIQNPPASGKYSALKTRLLLEYNSLDRDRASALLDMEGLGDRRPS